jgi:aryl-alcohol dehydrogenase-like predicted oxidoreductase
VERRELGTTGEKLSVVGFGGIVVMEETTEDAQRFVDEAIDRGVNYFDVAPTYGNAEERLGPALKPWRSGVFLACKTTERTKAGASKELARSLQRLKTDHFDLYQLHGVVSMDEVKSILAPGGALEAFVAAREKGLVRFLGFSAHSEEAACALLDAFPFDSVMFPVNYVTWLKGNFGPRVVDAARRRGAGVIALKALAQAKLDKGEHRPWSKCWYKPVDTPEEASLALRFTLSQPVTAALSPSHVELLRWQMDAADNLSPLSEAEMTYLKEKAAGIRPLFSHAQE